MSEGGGISQTPRGLRLIGSDERLVAELQPDPPRGYFGRYPIRGQGSLAQVDRHHPPAELQDCRVCGACRARACGRKRCALRELAE